MSVPEKVGENLYRGDIRLEKGSLGALVEEFGAQRIIGHPTYFNQTTIGPELKAGILGAARNFPGQKTAFVISDGSLTRDKRDTRTIDAALDAAVVALATLPPDARKNILVFAGSYDGYEENYTAGKGSALRVIYEEMAFTTARTLMLLDGDLRNDVAEWQAVYQKVIDTHERECPGQNYFITARYARHFVDASITRTIVGPLTTLLGTYVPGGISGDIVLSADAVSLERKTEWTDERRRYGTDIATTFDNIAKGTVIYEVYLGAKLHNVTDDAKLSVMPGEVIGSALERLLHYEQLDGRITRLLEGNTPLGRVRLFGPDKTGIGFINPGVTDVFRLAKKRNSLITRFPEFAPALKHTLSGSSYAVLEQRVKALRNAVENNLPAPLFLDLTADEWIALLHEILAYVLASGKAENGKEALNYLYTAAFLETCKNRFADLGLTTPAQIEARENRLGVDDAGAYDFYTERVDKAAETLAFNFYSRRKKLLARLRTLRG